VSTQSPNLLTLGNGKLGEGTYVFSLPALLTCPGSTPCCQRHCYALRGRLAIRSNRKRYMANWVATREASFVPRMCREIHRRFVACARIHVSGDFYSAAYIRAWVEIARACPHVRFYAYTRSWRVAKLRPALEELARCRNVRLWYSCDKDTGTPDRVPKRVRLAWMMSAEDDTPTRADLVFRVHRLRRTVQKRVGLALVCPTENGITDTDCGRCRVCIR
jgi:hypothetical protein